MLTDENFEDLKRKGYTVVSDVMTPEECDDCIGQYREWLSQFKDGEWPYTSHSLIQRYNSGHMRPTWYTRLKSKKVFAQVWNTDKLLSSFDAIAIGRPPEDGQEEFYKPGVHWLHVDQNAARIGLHAYQGAVYLEESCEDDWTLQVMEGSHLLLDEFFRTNVRASVRSTASFYRLRSEDVAYFEEKGCKIKRVPVPKGGMVLWDSRTVHANASPIKGRKNPGRYRYCVFVSMTPAIWTTDLDLQEKREAYNQVTMTTHWSSQGVSFFSKYIPSASQKDVDYPKTLPDIATTEEAKLLSGVKMYDFNDENPTGIEFLPKWETEMRLSNYKGYGIETNLNPNFMIGAGIVALCAVTVAIIGFYKFRN